jgi:hypothetical protein
MQVSKRFLERAKTSLRRYQKVLESAKARDVNESDTCVIISDFLADVLGYDKYAEVTTEFAVKSTFCDLAIKIGGELRFLIEVKSAGTDLRENHLRQAADYGANQGVEWIVLTNGSRWQAHRIRFEQPVQNDLVFSIDLLSPDTKSAELLEKLYLISKEGLAATAINAFWQRKEATSRFIIAQILLSAPTLALVRRQLRQMYPGLRVTEADIAMLIESEVIKRDAIEGDRAVAAQRSVRRQGRKREKPRAVTSGTPAADERSEAPQSSDEA